MTKQQNIEFGMVVTLVLLVLSLWLKIELYVYAVISILLSIVFPRIYTPLTWIWFRLAKILEIIMSNLILFLIFFLVVTPIGLIRRFAGKDNLQLKFQVKNGKSTFLHREHTFKKSDMEKQF